jgi:hypothetical protein
VRAGQVDRRLLKLIGVGIEEDAVSGGEVVDLAGSRDGCGADDGEGHAAVASIAVGVDRIASISRSGGDERGLSREAKRSQTHPAGHAQRG